MKNLHIFIISLSLIFFLGGCSEDANEPDLILGTWALSGVIYQDFPDEYSVNEGIESTSFYNEGSYILEFMEGSTFERDINDLVGASISGVHDNGDYTINGSTLSLNPLSGDTFVGIHNIFTVIEEANETSMVLETSVTLSVVSNDIWSTEGQLIDTSDIDAVTMFYATYSQSQSAKARLTFVKQ
ncbi:MAG: hypothetical protein JXR07_19660 [Reichenbachiella sp.]